MPFSCANSLFFNFFFLLLIIKANFQNVVNLKLLNPNLKIMCSIGGWDQGSLIFSIIANRPQSRIQFSAAVFNFVKRHNCDGVNIAWLHPGQRGGIPNDKISFGLLLQVIRQFLSIGMLISVNLLSKFIVN